MGVADHTFRSIQGAGNSLIPLPMVITALNFNPIHIGYGFTDNSYLLDPF